MATLDMKPENVQEKFGLEVGRGAFLIGQAAKDYNDPGLVTVKGFSGELVDISVPSRLPLGTYETWVDHEYLRPINLVCFECQQPIDSPEVAERIFRGKSAKGETTTLSCRCGFLTVFDTEGNGIRSVPRSTENVTHWTPY